MILAVTNSDETNMIACLLAKAMYNIPRKIARIRNPDYFFNKELLSKENLDINPAINPELEVARAISRLLEIPFATDVGRFRRGRHQSDRREVPDHVPFLGKPLMKIGELTPKRFLIGIIEREGKATIPSARDTVKPGDIIYMPVRREDIGETASVLQVSTRPSKRVMILGGGKIGCWVMILFRY